MTMQSIMLQVDCESYTQQSVQRNRVIEPKRHAASLLGSLDATCGFWLMENIPKWNSVETSMSPLLQVLKPSFFQFRVCGILRNGDSFHILVVDNLIFCDYSFSLWLILTSLAWIYADKQYGIVCSCCSVLCSGNVGSMVCEIIQVKASIWN